MPTSRTPGLLSPRQRSYLARLARSAWQRLTSAGAIDEPSGAWRHREAMQAADGHTISTAPRRYFDALEQHFLALSGQPAKAYDKATGPSNEERQLRHKIADLAAQLGLPSDYASGKPLRQLKGILINLTRQARAAQAGQA